MRAQIRLGQLLELVSDKTLHLYLHICHYYDFSGSISDYIKTVNIADLYGPYYFYVRRIDFGECEHGPYLFVEV